jgi:calcineurin-like phosphoesterase family protein
MCARVSGILSAVLIGLVGDLEGERDAALRWLRVLGERGDVQVAYQLGDLRFGMGPEPEACLAAIDYACAQYDLRLFCINGNHENWRNWTVCGAHPHGSTRMEV